MAPGFFAKVGDFFKKAWDGAKKVVKKVANVGAKVWSKVKPLVAPALKVIGTKYGVPAEAIDVGLGVGEGVLNKVGDYTPPEEQSGAYPQEEQYEEEPQEEEIIQRGRTKDPGPAYYLRQSMKNRKA
jgi:hypothetical protein